MTTLKTSVKNKKTISFFKNKVKLSVLSSTVAFMALTSCSGNDDASSALNCGGGLWTQSVQSELTAWLTASQTYAQEQTTSNCQKNKSAGQSYIAALDKIKDCVPSLSLLDFEEALAEAKVEINAIPCN